MLQIRQNVFETNSSSSHSIVVKKKESYSHDQFREECKDNYCGEGIIRCWEMDMVYGRGFDILIGWKDRLQFAIASYGDSPDAIEDMLDRLRKRIPEFVDVSFSFRYEDDFDEAGVREYPGYIDHQSYGLLQRFVAEEGITLDEFVLNDKYIVIIDGDEYNRWDAIKETKIINMDDIEKEYSAMEYC